MYGQRFAMSLGNKQTMQTFPTKVYRSRNFILGRVSSESTATSTVRRTWNTTTFSLREYTTQQQQDNVTSAPKKKLFQKGKWIRRGLLASAIVGVGTLAYILQQDKEYLESAIQQAHDNVPPLALHPDTGGKKNLPVVSHQLDDNPLEEDKPRLVIVGSGWGAVSVLKSLDKDKYNVTVISENNYFLFTPLLPSATVGTLELRSLLEPIRKIAARVQGHFLEGKAVDVDIDNKLVEVERVKHNGVPLENERYYVPYDKLVIAVGATSISHGVEGLEHTLPLKTIVDAINIRRKIMNNVEQAALPTTTPEERKRLLSFVAVGGGPTNVEVAAELSDWIEEDFVKWFPKSMRPDVSVTIIQSRDHILNTFDHEISNYAENRFKRKKINVVTNSRVERIEDGKVIYRRKSPDSDSSELVEIPFGLCLWATGIAMTSFTKNLAEQLDAQRHQRVLWTDEYLRVKGIPDHSIFALGDCASIQNPKLVNRIIELFERADKNHDGMLTMEEFAHVVKYISRRYPLTKQHLGQLVEMFDTYDKDKNGLLDMDEMRTLLQDVDSKMTHLPATAQVASQQGNHLGHYLNVLAKEKGDEDKTNAQVNPFDYKHLGALAYLGNTAVGEFNTGTPGGFKMLGGLWALYLWRSVYWSEQVSLRTRLNLSIDWTKTGLFGRDISSI
ncbi:pyridine nucleotide-disulfide oxidoreductase-domain-containing protein [Halteromyces radiatus]|uniref:pyridine nucleotide-disulfide oxidoreductase-domain-containing protein n=1 Tax=Halteromyces radiatus TaxID=101107 RepID=UPI002220C22B|nr:pyridine nucleotide-disulfide oxidoreductase-domain-containing protein [Halteromyces radiatus]KAI8081474.1 pyridine nucleotide-disulfide oxidoreductase-domain-containing protein [Halteromyces radiatus]